MQLLNSASNKTYATNNTAILQATLDLQHNKEYKFEEIIFELRKHVKAVSKWNTLAIQ